MNPEFGPDADEDLPEEVLAAIESGTSPLAAVRQWKQLSAGGQIRRQRGGHQGR